MGAITPKQILFAISGLGLGNSTRCDALIEELARQGYRIDILASANAYTYFVGDKRVDRLFRLASLDYAGGKNGINLLKTLTSLPRLAKSYRHNVRQLSEILASQSYRALVIDSDYSIAALRHKIKIPVIAVNNSDVIAANAKNFFRFPPSARPHLLLELLDYAFHRVVPDLVVSPWAAPPVKKIPRVLHVPPLVRTGQYSRKNRKREKLNILIVPGGSRFSGCFKDVEKLSNWKDVRVQILGRQGKSTRRVTYRPFTREVTPLLNADILVINAGFSSISEAIVYRKPAVVVPIQNHAEQYQNAMTLERLGLGLVADENNWVEKLRALRFYLEEFQEAHERFSMPGNGAEAAARYIDRFLLN